MSSMEMRTCTSIFHVGSLILFLASTTRATSYSVSVSPTTVGINGTVILSCRITNPTGFSVVWRRKFGNDFINIGIAGSRSGCIIVTFIKNHKWDICGKPTTASPRDYNLKIVKAQPSDSSTWDCLDVGAGTPSDPVKVKVQVPPTTPIVRGLEKPVGVGTTHTLTCDAHQQGISDTITYTWYKDNTVKATGNKLHFTPVTKTDAGTYKCEAKNAVATKFSQNIDLEVYYAPDTITLSATKSTRPINEKETFTCTISGGNPPNPTLTIYRDKGGKQQLFNGTGPTIELRDVTMVKDDNGAKYYCESSLSGYQTVSKISNEITYTVHYPHSVSLLSNSSTTVVAGSTFILTCNATGGNPATVQQYSWKRNGKTLQSTSRVYNIHDVKYYEGGMYACAAKNEGGSASGSMNITINYPPMWNPRLPEVLTSITSLNQPARLTLHVIANPAATGASWYRYYGPTNFTTLGSDFTPATVNETTYTLSTKSVKQTYFGKYKVDVASPTGPTTFIFELRTPDKPYPPCCLSLLRETSVSVTLMFKAGFFGGSAQSFTIEYSERDGHWMTAKKNIPDPWTGQNATEKIQGLKGNTRYDFRVFGRNVHGKSGYSNIAVTKTDVAPSITSDDISVIRVDSTVIKITWPALGRLYTRIDVIYCVIDGQNRGACATHVVKDTSINQTALTVDKDKEYTYTFKIIDTDDVVFQSSALQSQTVSVATPTLAIVGGTLACIAGLVVAAVVTFLVIKKKRADNARLPSGTTSQENPAFVSVYDEIDQSRLEESPIMKAVSRYLPNAGNVTREQLQTLFTAQGVREIQDLLYLEAKDIMPPLKLVEARKFLQQLRDLERRGGDNEGIYLEPTSDPEGVRHDDYYSNIRGLIGQDATVSRGNEVQSDNPNMERPEDQENAYASLEQDVYVQPDPGTYAKLTEL